MKPRVEVWINDRLTWSQEYRSTAAARREATSRIETCLNYNLRVEVTKRGEWWIFTCEQEGRRHQIRVNIAEVPPPPDEYSSSAVVGQEL